MAMGLEPMWTDLSDMLATCTDDQLLKWKEVAENPKGDNFKFITTLRQAVVHMYNKRTKDIINELSIAVNDEMNYRNGSINMDKKLEQRIARLERLIKEGYQSYNIDEISESIYNEIKGLVIRTKMHIDELKIEHMYDQVAEWQDVLQDMRDLANKVNSIK